ncbi:MAG: YheC/YheD family protein [Syntrophomonadaceae bacterium]
MVIVGKISVSRKLVESLGIDIEPLITVRVGAIIVKSRLQVHDHSKSKYMLSPELIKALHIRKAKGLRIRYQAEEKMLHLGPTLGIFATYIPGSSREEVDPRSLQAELIYLSIVGNSFPGHVYIFTPNGINWANKTCRGYVYKQLSSTRGHWVSALYPIPDVVYDRIHSRTNEARSSVKYAKSRLMQMPYLHYFNPYYLNKWNVHEVLAANPMLQDYLPETRQLDEKSLIEMLQNYRILFLKPSNGSLGKGIIKITKEKGHLKYVVYRSTRIRGQASNAAELLKKTKAFRDDRPYIVQQGLELIRYHGSSFDLRIIYQKNNQGEWMISKKFCRVAPRGSSISNLSSGGRVVKSTKVLRNIFKKDKEITKRYEEIRCLCKIVATTLENTSNKIFGELGLDIGIGHNGHLYLIEVNSKPRKTTETQFSPAIVRNTFKRPLLFASYLAGFKI